MAVNRGPSSATINPEKSCKPTNHADDKKQLKIPSLKLEDEKNFAVCLQRKGRRSRSTNLLGIMLHNKIK